MPSTRLAALDAATESSIPRFSIQIPIQMPAGRRERPDNETWTVLPGLEAPMRHFRTRSLRASRQTTTQALLTHRNTTALN